MELVLNGGSLNYGSSFYNVVNKNIVTNNIGGISLWGKPSSNVSYNVILENNVTNSEGEIMFRYYTSYNKVNHNNMIDNINSLTDEPINIWDYGKNNYWDNGMEGNY